MRDLQQAIKEGGFTPRSPENPIIAEQARTIALLKERLQWKEADRQAAIEELLDSNALVDEIGAQLRKARQEMQQWEDETCLEIDELDSIIDGQQEYIKTIQAQLHNTLERKLQMSFALSAAQQEIASLKHSHSEVCEMNRRLCLDLQNAEQDAQNRYDQAVEQFKNCERTHVRLDTWREEHNRANKAEQEAAVARVQADNATQDAINCRRTNDSLLDINQTLSAKLVAIEQALNPCPTPQQGETVPPRPMWSRYRSE
jgi:chromosome segregation ATPase